LDKMKLTQVLRENASRDPCEVSILFAITASSSFLFFDQEHHPRHVELCSELKRFDSKHPFVRVNFITCPTTKEAMKAPSLDQPCYGEFAQFANTMADTWWDFKSDQHVDSNQISSLIQTSRGLQSTRLASKPLEDVDTLRWVSPRAGFFLLGIIAHWLFSFMFVPHTMPQTAYPIIPPLRRRNATMEHLHDAEVFRTHVEELERKVEPKNGMVQMLQKKLQAENQTNSKLHETAQTWKLRFEKSQRLLQPLEKQLKTKNESIQQLQEQHEKQIQEENTTEQKVLSLKIRIQTLKQNEAQTIHEWNIAIDIILALMMFSTLFLVVFLVVYYRYYWGPYCFVRWHRHEEVQKPLVPAESAA